MKLYIRYFIIMCEIHTCGWKIETTSETKRFLCDQGTEWEISLSFQNNFSFFEL